MNDSFQYADLVLLGMVAFFIALRLRAILGKQTGADPREIWKQATRESTPDKVVVFPERGRVKPAVEPDIIPEALQQNKPAADGLKAIKAADPQFSTTEFLSGAKMAFEWVLQAFTAGDKDKLATLLSDERFLHFAEEIDARKPGGQTHENTLVSVSNADITEAELSAGVARITVQFTSEQISVIRDKDKNVVGGDATAIENVVDIWTFEREISSRNPNWKITAT